MSLDLNRLSAQGRAYGPNRPWSSEELEALLTLEKERGLSRIKAADYIRNGILTIEAFDKATKSEFVPKTLEQAQTETEASLKERGASFKKLGKRTKK